MDDDSDAAFDAACAAARALPDGALSVEAKLALYALYKQATVGDCAEAKPAFWELERGAKWRAWRGRAGLAATEAREAYCSLVAELLPQGGASSVEDEKQRPPQAGIGGKAVSTLLVGASDEEDDDEDSAPALVAAARSGDVKAVEAALSQTQNARETTDAQGRSALHWAADCGHAEIVRRLLRAGAAVDARDDGACSIKTLSMTTH
mmetsp:Transcript_22834/g.90529  ORF Transcript_22834/g.90529 Transcript_22834/m.90529 type:complete len:207 (-) Transcript_22834:1077-1697(-)